MCGAVNKLPHSTDVSQRTGRPAVSEYYANMDHLVLLCTTVPTVYPVGLQAVASKCHSETPKSKCQEASASTRDEAQIKVITFSLALSLLSCWLACTNVSHLFLYILKQLI